MLVLFLGVIAALLDRRGLPSPVVRLGRSIIVPVSERLSSLDPFVQLTLVVAVAFLTAMVFSAAVWLHRRAADRSARMIVRDLHDRVLVQSIRRAEVEGAAAGRRRAEDLIGTQLPRLQSGLGMWFRVMPRSILTLAGCVVLAFLAEPWLSLIAVPTGYYLWQWVLKLRQSGRDEIRDWEVPRLRRRMAALVGGAPMLARLQTPDRTTEAFSAEANQLYRRLEISDRGRGRIWPMVFAAVAFAVAVLILGLGVSAFEESQPLVLPSALVLTLSLCGAAMAVSRIMSLRTQLVASKSAEDSIYSYLGSQTSLEPTEQRVGLGPIRDGVRIDGVTLDDSTGRNLLSALSIGFAPGEMVALMGTEEDSTRAIAELMMGFGLPREGSVTIDEISIREVHPKSLADKVIWIDPSGPIWDGTVAENIRGGNQDITNSDLIDAVQQLDVYERLHRLPEGLSTILSTSERDLDDDTTYAIGVARALVQSAPIILVAEPPPPAEHLTEDPCLSALKDLTDQGSMVIVLPRRLLTLRAADRVVLLNGPRLAGEGTHTRLLADSDLYRHLNYLLFNPYRRS